MISLNDIKIEPMTLDKIIEVQSISDEQFGEGYITQKYIREYINSENHKVYMALSEKNLIGFYFMQICSIKKLTAQTKVENKIIEKTLHNYEPVAFIEHTAVKKQLTGKGIGNEIIKFQIEESKKIAKSIFRISWKSSNGTHIESILKKNYFKKVIEIPDYWKEDSIKKAYKCAVCGNPPCRCSAVIYIKLL